jgi:CDP-diacylglycerol pyrophosphatase
MTTPPTTNGCCDSTDPLWKKIDQRATDCQHNHQHCKWIDLTAGYALAPYDAQVPNLLVPTKCIKGIECPVIREQSSPNYWDLAWQQLANQSWTTNKDIVGMAINSAGMRHFNQLHIHVRSIDSAVQAELVGYGNKIGQTWVYLSINDPKAKGGQPHQYRVRCLENDVDLANHPLFQLVYDKLKEEYRDGAKAAQHMQDQTLVVAKRNKGFYVLNSDTTSPSLNKHTSGVGDGERLLYPPP